MLKIFLVVVYAVALAIANPSIPVPRPDPNWLARHESFVQNTKDSNGSIPIIFYGASIVDFWDDEGKQVWDEKYVPLGAVNYGISADKIEHVMWRVLNGEVEGLNPKLIMLHVGGNNIYGGDTDDEIVEGLGKLVQLFRDLMPNTKVLILGVLPRGEVADFIRVANVNIKTAPLENGDSVRYLNMMDQFSESWGVVNKELYKADLLHLVTAGYVVWDRTMSHIFNEMLEE